MTFGIFVLLNISILLRLINHVCMRMNVTTIWRPRLSSLHRKKARLRQWPLSGRDWQISRFHENDGSICDGQIRAQTHGHGCDRWNQTWRRKFQSPDMVDRRQHYFGSVHHQLFVEIQQRVRRLHRRRLDGLSIDSTSKQKQFTDIRAISPVSNLYEFS